MRVLAGARARAIADEDEDDSIAIACDFVVAAANAALYYRP